MKIGLLLFLSFCLLPVFGETFFDVEWSEFCPRRYQNINTSRWHYTSSGRYWAGRREDFDRRLEKCNNLSTDASKRACYKELREIELRKTELYNSEKGNNTLRYLLLNSML